MRMLSLAMIGALCLGVMPCAQTANPRDDHQLAEVSQSSDEIASPPRLFTRPPKRTLTAPQIAGASPDHMSPDRVGLGQVSRNGISIIHGKPKPIHQVVPVDVPAVADEPGLAAGKQPQVESLSPALAAPRHDLQTFPESVAAADIRLEPSFAGTTTGESMRDASISLVNAEVPIDPRRYPSIDPDPSNPIVIAGSYLPTVRPRVPSRWIKEQTIAGAIAPTILPAEPESVPVPHAVIAVPIDEDRFESQHVTGDRISDSMRPVSSGHLAFTPDPVGAIPSPIGPMVPSRVPSPLMELPTVNAEIGPIHPVTGNTGVPGQAIADSLRSDAAELAEVNFEELVVETIPASTRRVVPVAGQTDASGELPAKDQPRELETPLVIPLRSAPVNKNVTIERSNGLVTLVATEVELRDVLRMIANHHRLNLVIGPNVKGPVTVNIQGARLDEVLDAILGVAGFHWHTADNLLYVTGGEETSLDPRVQGRRLQVYPLNYVAARDIEVVVAGLLTPIGKAYSSSADSVDQLKTRELLVVEDNESGHLRVTQYLAQVDIPPRQVLVEAHVLQIDLSDEERHGVNLRALARVSGAKLILEGEGFAEEAPEGPSLAFRINGTDVGHLIEAIHTNTNSRTLASPKVSVVNRQTAKVQIGQRLPYAVATTTQTATIQNVQFLDVGIVLDVTPVITHDDNILMTVLPKVSGGRITESGFPEEDTTQVSTTVLMPDGSGLVIGGLIRETDNQSVSMVPKLGQIPVIKRLFTRRASETRRNELVVALVTHIMHGAEPVRQKECLDLREALPDHAASELHYSPEIRYSND